MNESPAFSSTATIELTDATAPNSGMASFIAGVMSNPQASGHRVRFARVHMEPGQGYRRHGHWMEPDGAVRLVYVAPGSDVSSLRGPVDTLVTTTYRGYLDTPPSTNPLEWAGPTNYIDYTWLAPGYTKSTVTEAENGALVASKSEFYSVSGPARTSEMAAAAFSGGGGAVLDAKDRVLLREFLHDGTYEEFTYSCCHLQSHRDRNGINTAYVRDALGRVLQEQREVGPSQYLTTVNGYDAMGRVTSQKRRPVGGTGSTDVLLSETAYDLTGMVASTTAIGGLVTTYAKELQVSSLIKHTTVHPHPDGAGTAPESVIYTYSDGSLVERSGTAEHPSTAEYGVDASSEFTGFAVEWAKHVTPGTSGQTSEWTKSYSDPLHNSYKVAFSDSSYSRTYFDAAGHAYRKVDPDGKNVFLGQKRALAGVSTLPTAVAALVPADADWTLVGADTDGNGQLTFGSSDRISMTVTRYVPDYVEGTTSHESVSYEWKVNGDDDNTIETSRSRRVVSRDDNPSSIVNELASTVLGVTTTHITLLDRSSRQRVSVTTHPDGTASVEVREYGLIASNGEYAADDTLLVQRTSSFDDHGRAETITDTRVTTTTADDRVFTVTYDTRDRISQQATPAPGFGGSAQTTVYTYDDWDRVKQVTLPDSSVQHKSYFLTGELQKQYGSQVYPTEYTYDLQGRLKTLTTWKDFNESSGSGTTGNATTTWSYHSQRGWLSGKSYQGSTGPSYAYTNAGRLQTRTWARGVSTTYSYNGAGDLSTVNYSDSTPDVAFTYDRRGRATEIVDGVGTRELTHDDSGNLDYEDFTAGILDAVSVDNEFDSLFRREEHKVLVSSTLQSSVAYGYSANTGRYDSVTKGNLRAEYGYEPGSDLIATTTFRNGTAPTSAIEMTVTRTWDALNRLREIHNDSAASGGVDEKFTYTLNSLNQRTRTDLLDGSYWEYSYDGMGQVLSGKRRKADNSFIPGQQFTYGFDDIGNRTGTGIGGDPSGNNLRTASYTSNILNQYTSRDVSRGVDVMGYSAPGATSVTVNGSNADHRWNDFYQELVSFSGSGSVFSSIPINWDPPTGGPEETRYLFLQATPEVFTYDADGNTLTDGRWAYTWDGENRLIRAETDESMLMRIDYVYDYMSRRCGAWVYGWLNQESLMSSGATITDANSSSTTSLEDTGEGTQGSPNTMSGSWTLSSTYKFVWDGWNLSMELDGNDAVVRSMGWGLDLSGSEQGAGGVGGLLFMTETASNQTYHPTFDGNGNVVSMRRGDGVAMSRHEYGPFGEAITSRDSFASLNPWRFSTKYQDGPTGLLYYGYRYYNPGTGRWLGRDPIGELGGVNAFSFNYNSAIGRVDRLGLDPDDIQWHHLIPRDVRAMLAHIEGLNIDAAEFGLLMRHGDHCGKGGPGALHKKYNTAWRRELDAIDGVITREHVDSILKKLRESDEYRDWLSHGVPATVPWKEGGKWSCDKLAELKRAIQGAQDKGLPVSAKLLELFPEGKSLSQVTGKSLATIPGAKYAQFTIRRGGKAVPVVGWVIGGTFFIVDVASGKPAAEAGVDAILPIGSVQGFKDTRDFASEALWGEINDLCSQAAHGKDHGGDPNGPVSVPALYRELGWRCENPCSNSDE